MSSPLLHPPTHLSPALALRVSQQAPAILQASPSAVQIPLLSTAETPETWTLYENLLLSCLRTGDDRSAHLCLEKLSDRFGVTNERVMGLRGMYQEAVAEDNAALSRILREYEDILKEDPTNTPIAKRRIALLRSMSQPAEATAALVELLDAYPTDAEAWAELSDLYISQGLYQQAIFSLEEVLLITPNAWTIHARMGELVYISTTAPGNDTGLEKGLTDAMRWFCRSIELCDDYLRGYYGLKMTTGRLLQILSQKQKPPTSFGNAGSENSRASVASVQKLNERATAKLKEIVQKNTSGAPGWTGYNQEEVIAARELLDRD